MSIHFKWIAAAVVASAIVAPIRAQAYSALEDGAHSQQTRQQPL
jgi:hypothetical protein